MKMLSLEELLAIIERDENHAVSASQLAAAKSREEERARRLAPYQQALRTTLTQWLEKGPSKFADVTLTPDDNGYGEYLGEGWALIQLGHLCFMVQIGCPDSLPEICLRITCPRCGASSVPSRPLLSLDDLWLALKQPATVPCYPTHRCY